MSKVALILYGVAAFLAVIIAVWVVPAVSAISCALGSKTAIFAKMSYTTSMEPVAIDLVRENRINDRKAFTIPKAYLRTSAAWRGGCKRDVPLLFTYPELSPASFQAREKPGLYNSSDLPVTVTMGSDVSFRARHHANIRSSITGYSQRHFLPATSDVEGLEAFVMCKRGEDRCDPAEDRARRYLLLDRADMSIVDIRCDRARAHRPGLPRCAMSIWIDDLHFQISLPRHAVREWRTLKSNVVALVRNFERRS